MTDRKALSLASSALQEEGLQDSVEKVDTIHFSTAQERQAVLGADHPDVSDYWYISFLLKLDKEVVSQDPNSLLVQIDDRTSVAKVVYQI